VVRTASGYVRVTDTNGFYSFNLSPGTNDMVASASGIGTNAISSVVVSDTQTQVINFVLGAGGIILSPATGFAASGRTGGPFSPGFQTYALTNSSVSNVPWMTANGAAWLTVSPGSGVLAPGTGTNITATINNSAISLAAGIYSDAISVSNLATGIGNTSRSVTLAVTNPIPVISSNSFSLLAESCIASNGTIDPGEQVTVSLGLRNVGSADSTNLIATLLATNGVGSPSPAQTYGALLAGGPATAQPFTFTASGTCGGSITANFRLTDGTASLGNIAIPLSLGSQGTVFVESFDGVSAPSLPAGWTVATTGSQANWVSSATSADTAPNAAFSSEATAAGVNELDSPVFMAPSGSAKISFRHSYNLENNGSTGYDGGVLEIRIGTNAYADIISAGGSFVSGAYNTTISSSFSNPLAGRSAWSGNSGGFLTTVVNLPASAAGQNVQLRWRCATDSGVSASGWFVDSITVTGATCCTGPVPPTITSQPQSQTALVGANVTLSAVANGTQPLAYEWRSNNVPVPGATSATYSITNVQVNAAASYYVIVTNSYGSDTSTVAVLTVATGYTGILAGWDVNGLTNFGVSPMSPTTNAPNVIVGGLTRGSGVTTPGTAAPGAWGGAAFNAASSPAAVTANEFATLSLTPAAGCQVSFGSVSAFNYRRSSTGPPSGVLQYRLGAGTFNDLATFSYATGSGGHALSAVDLSGIAALQTVGAGTNVTFRIVNYGASSSAGTWYIYDVAANSDPDFAISGTVAALPSHSPIEQWRLQYFGTTANSGPAANDAIASSDGMPNLLKYALGLNPLMPATNPVSGGITNGFLTMWTPKNPNATDITMRFESSSNLLSGWGTNNTTVDQNSPTWLQTHDNTPLPSARQRFMRLRVTEP
jgi:hypothetical protein